MRYRTDLRGATKQHGAMKTPLETFMAPYSAWLNASWSVLTGMPLPGPEESPKAVQADAEQEWEHEGGSLRP